ncbi:NACHT domain- and WD repeat-containing protein 1, partial [Cichlidogyrus casuarinus]
WQDEIEAPIPELVNLCNAIRISALSLSNDSSSLALDIIGRLTKTPTYLAIKEKEQQHSVEEFLESQQRKMELQSRQFLMKIKTVLRNHAKTELDRLVREAKLVGSRHCAFQPRTLCFDSGSGAVYTTFDIGMSIAVLMDNGLLFSALLDSNTQKWYDLEGNLVKKCNVPGMHFVLLKSLVSKVRTPSPTSIFVTSTKYLQETKTKDDELSELAIAEQLERDKNKNASDDEEAADTSANNREKLMDVTSREMNVIEMDLFVGRTSFLKKLDQEWSRAFVCSDVEFADANWLLSQRNNGEISFGHWPSSQLIIGALPTRKYCTQLLAEGGFLHFTHSRTKNAFMLDVNHMVWSAIPFKDEQFALAVRPLKGDDSARF